MSRIVYVNGRYLPWSQAAIHAEDRGFQFGDAVYEVCEVRDGRMIDETRHMDRLERSLGELRIPVPMARPALSRVLRETIRRNRVRDGSVYLQVSRGARPRDFLFSDAASMQPTVVCVARSVSRDRMESGANAGIGVKSVPDIRWGRCDIKTVMLLPASLAKEEAKKIGAKEAWLVDADGFVTEGASSNAWIVDKAGRLITRQASVDLLKGITRTTLMDLIRREGLELVERSFTIAEALEAREAFVTSATSIVTPVVSIDGRPIGNGAPGILSLQLRAKFHEFAEAAAP
ncbi:MAG TPA: D-amino-acid transaminase [Hyphomicrobiaceae bacterium]|nr:D-amino-acid transaminase [Hyphomicrobiaceae bacterium]